MFDEPQVVRVRNNGKKPYKDQYANLKYTIAPGQEVLVPWGAAILWLGDPRTVNDELHGYFQRDEELLRVLIRMGSHGLDGRNLSEAERAVRDRPPLAVFDVNNEPIEMLLDDPEGENVTPATFVKGEKDDLFAELDKVKAYQAQLLQLIENAKNAQTAPGLDSALDDAPTRVPGPAE